jgi:hypothetical protein
MNMVPKIYIDTSVVGGFFDKEFRIDTSAFFERLYERKIKIVLSDLMEAELVVAPKRVQDFYDSLPEDQIIRTKLSKEAIALADNYIKSQVVGKTSKTDCRHIAIATVFRADVLVSWNFKHIVNLKRIHGYNAINLKEGFQILEIRSPKELIDYEK